MVLSVMSLELFVSFRLKGSSAVMVLLSQRQSFSSFSRQTPQLLIITKSVTKTACLNAPTLTAYLIFAHKLAVIQPTYIKIIKYSRYPVALVLRVSDFF